jgi:hypothetical protein
MALQIEDRGNPFFFLGRNQNFRTEKRGENWVY